MRNKKEKKEKMDAGARGRRCLSFIRHCKNIFLMCYLAIVLGTIYWYFYTERPVDISFILILILAGLVFILLGSREHEIGSRRKDFFTPLEPIIGFLMKLCLIASTIFLIAFLLVSTKRLSEGQGSFECLKKTENRTSSKQEPNSQISQGTVNIAIQNNLQSPSGENPNEEKQKYEVVSVTKMHLSLISIVLAGFGVAGAWWAKSLEDRLKEYDKEKGEFDEMKSILTKNVLQSAEIAVSQLMSNPAYTQQIPSGVVHGLNFLDKMFSSSSVATEALQESSNNISLKYYYSIYLLGLNPKDKKAAEYLYEVIKFTKGKHGSELYLLSNYRAAIYHRQKGEHYEAKKLYNETKDTPMGITWKRRITTGLLILELSRTQFWEIEDREVSIQGLENPKEVKRLICKIIGFSEDEDYYMEDNVKYYLLKAASRLKYKHPDVWERISAHKQSRIKKLELTLTGVEELWDKCEQSIYKYFDGYCIIVLENFKYGLALLNVYRMILDDDGALESEQSAKNELDSLCKNLDLFGQYVDEMQYFVDGYFATIYSERLEREVPIDSFRSELEGIKAFISTIRTKMN